MICGHAQKRNIEILFGSNFGLFSAPIYSMALSHDGTMIAAATTLGIVQVFDVRSSYRCGDSI